MARIPHELRIGPRHTLAGRELRVRTSRSSGPGGQHVNRTESRVELRWSLRDSTSFSAADLAWLRQRLAGRLTSRGELLIVSERYRDQRRNVQDALDRFRQLLRDALARPTPRKKTRPSRGANERRLKSKRQRSTLKDQRRRSWE